MGTVADDDILNVLTHHEVPIYESTEYLYHS